jgi:ribosome-associated protein
MTQRIITSAILMPEVSFTTSRSSGPGGQNVNKVNSKVTLRFSINESMVLSEDEKAFLVSKLSSKITRNGEILINAQDKRSQAENKLIAIEKFDKLLAKAFEKKKARKASKPSKSSVAKRLEKKKMQSEKKQWRKNIE